MLHRNIHTTNGLVNGACGTVIAVGKKAVTVKFDHDEEEDGVNSNSIGQDEKELLSVNTT